MVRVKNARRIAQMPIEGAGNLADAIEADAWAVAPRLRPSAKEAETRRGNPVYGMLVQPVEWRDGNGGWKYAAEPGKPVVLVFNQ